ncbi:MAG: PHP domain-containing protein [Phycisphaerae bacterium]|nr:PHP domain-containing protein [Phycisphaerae bacterium]
MRRFVDLHTHSTASDGSLRPAELVALADAAGLAAMALTDHDTTVGLAEAKDAARGFPELRFVEGIEISAKWPVGTLHILGLGIDEQSPPLRAVMARLQAARAERNPKIIAKLRDMGIDIDMDEVLGAACCGEPPAQISGSGSPGRPGRIIGRLHIAEVLRAKGCAGSTAEAFDKYIGNYAPGFVDKERLTPPEAIGPIHEAGGLAVLAHPVQLGCENRAQLTQSVRDLQAAGIDGIEVYHTDHSPDQTRAYLGLARRLGLGVVGGSDFHGAAKPGAVIARPPVSLRAIGKLWSEKLLGL